MAVVDVAEVVARVQHRLEFARRQRFVAVAIDLADVETLLAAVEHAKLTGLITGEPVWPVVQEIEIPPVPANALLYERRE